MHNLLFNTKDTLSESNYSSNTDPVALLIDISDSGYKSLGLAVISQAILDYMRLFNNLNENQLTKKSIMNNKTLIHSIREAMTFFESDWFELLSSNMIAKDCIYKELRRKGYYVPECVK